MNTFRQTGECWAGHSNQHDYKQHGADIYDGCIGDDYQPCKDTTRYCVGNQWRNMVYKIGRFFLFFFFIKSVNPSVFPIMLTKCGLLIMPVSNLLPKQPVGTISGKLFEILSSDPKTLK